LFLDEIGDVSLDVQAMLLRAVQEGVIQPLGGSTMRVNVRLIAATDSDLESAVARREFREPLLRRFSYEIHVPALRRRRDDIGLLFHSFVRDRLRQMGEVDRLAPADAAAEPWVPAAFVAELALYDWPGNVRELANVALTFAVENRDRVRGRMTDDIKRALRSRSAPAVETTEDGPPPSGPGPAAREVADADVVAAMRAEKFSVVKAARRLGLSKSHLYERLRGVPEVRLVDDLPEDEIQTALAACAGDVEAAATRLQVSSRALNVRLSRRR
jgi:two-component system nitrogen regulation response regulator GlnG